MRTLYLSCEMGAAGDMLCAALLELFPDREEMIGRLNSLEIPGIRFEAEDSFKCGIKGTHLHVYVDGEEEGHEHHHERGEHEHHHEHDDHEHHHEHGEHEHHHEHGEHEHTDADGHAYHHSHSDLHSIGHIVRDHMKASEEVREQVLQVYQLLAEAESTVHGTEVSQIHFHEVGDKDAIADITAFCYLLRELSVDEVIVSPVHVGKGTVKCAHGILPVPAPATACLLKGIPIYSKDEITGELCTPTGAALLKHFASSFGSMPAMIPEKTGYGMGTKDFPQANCVRAILGTTADRKEQILELSCNVDDMTGEEIGFVMDLLFRHGALDVFTVPIGMKKSRPGIMIHVVCRERDKENILSLLFRHTSTIGIRESVKNRYVLDRKITTRKTSLGDVRIKTSDGYGIRKEKIEYEDLAAIAEKQGCSLREAMEIIERGLL